MLVSKNETFFLTGHCEFGHELNTKEFFFNFINTFFINKIILVIFLIFSSKMLKSYFWNFLYNFITDRFQFQFYRFAKYVKKVFFLDIC